MKNYLKFTLILLITLLGSTDLFSQESYTIKIKDFVFDKYMRGGNQCGNNQKVEIRIRGANNSELIYGQSMYDDSDLRDDNGNSLQPSAFLNGTTFNSNYRPTGIMVYAYMNGRNGVGNCSRDVQINRDYGPDRIWNDILICNNVYSYYKKRRKNGTTFAYLDIGFKLSVTPNISITSTSISGQNVHLEVTSGFPEELYNLQYSTDNSNWYNLSNLDYTDASDNGTIDFPTSSLTSLPNNYAGSIYFRFKNCDVGSSSSSGIILPPALEPNIFDIVNASCLDFENERIIVRFNRNLFTGETLQYSITTDNEVNLGTFTGTPSGYNHELQIGHILNPNIPHLESGSYTIEFWSEYNVVTIPASPPSLSFSINNPIILEIEEVTSTDTSVTLEWQDPYSNHWEIRYGLSNYLPSQFPAGVGEHRFVSNTPRTTIDNLIPSNAYDFWIRSVCSSDIPAHWVEANIETKCTNCTSFIPQEGKEYVISAWAKEDHANIPTTVIAVDKNDIILMLNDLITNYDPANPYPDNYINQGLQNIIDAGAINPNISKPTIYNFHYDKATNEFSFQFGIGQTVQTFSANCTGSTFGEIVSVDNFDISSFTIGFSCDGSGNIHNTSNYFYGLDTYITNVTTIPGEQVYNYENVYIQLTFLDNTNQIVPDFTGEANRKYYPNITGDIIDGWQRISGTFKVPRDTVKINIELVNDFVTDAFFDDVRIFPKEGNMKSFVYDQKSQKLMAELDENNYATFYEYDIEGGLIRVKKETEKGVFTIQETRSGNVKKPQN